MFLFQRDSLFERIGPDESGVTIIQVNEQAYRKLQILKLFGGTLALGFLMNLAVISKSWQHGADMYRGLLLVNLLSLALAGIGILQICLPLRLPKLHLSPDGIEKRWPKRRNKQGRWDQVAAVHPGPTSIMFSDGEVIGLWMNDDLFLRPEDVACIVQYSGDDSLLRRAWADQNAAPRAHPIWFILACVSLLPALLLFAYLGYIAGCAYYEVPPELVLNLPVYAVVSLSILTWAFTYFSYRRATVRGRWFLAKMKEGRYGIRPRRKK